MDAILSVAQRHGVTVVEDNANSVFSRYRGRYTGTFGQLATQSFHETKNITCGEGGALLVNDPQLVERAIVLRDMGTNRDRFLRGQVDKYTWVDVGSSYIASDLLAAFLYAQLEAREEIQSTRERIWQRYQARVGRMGGAERRATSCGTGALRAVVPHVLPAAAVDEAAHGFDCSPQGTRHPGSVSLCTATSFPNGTEARRG